MKTTTTDLTQDQNYYSLLARKQLMELKDDLYKSGHEVIYNNAMEFISLSPNDKIFKDVSVKWDDDYKEIDFKWDTKRLDCRVSICIEGYSWKIWAGDNNHSKDDRCDAIGLGGNEITQGEDWAFWFYDYMNEVVTELSL
jgi:hypothetical protein